MDGWRLMDGQGCFQKTKTDAAQPVASLWRAGSYIFPCIEDDTSHLGLDFPVNTWRRTWTSWGDKGVANTTIVFPLQGPTAGPAVTPMTALDTLTSPHFHAACFSHSVTAITCIIIPQLPPQCRVLRLKFIEKHHHHPRANSSNKPSLSVKLFKVRVVPDILLMKSSDVSALRARVAQQSLLLAFTFFSLFSAFLLSKHLFLAFRFSASLMFHLTNWPESSLAWRQNKV